MVDATAAGSTSADAQVTSVDVTDALSADLDSLDGKAATVMPWLR
ncbi:MAG: hypothetical protein ACREHD_32240 [Pirellulales bacterium]